MDNYAYQPSYPDSGDSSPRSREIDFENPPPWEDSQNPPPNYKVKFMCSYGGKIQPRPHDNQLSYMGGETKILAVDRNIKFASLIAKLSAVCDGEGVSFKYQLPGEDLDALISVTNDDDLEHMMGEYDRLYRASPKPARLRLFLFPATPPPQQTTVPTVVSTRSFGSEETVKSEKERFVEALNSGPINTITPPSAVAPPPVQAGNVDFLFGLEKGMAPPQLQQQQQQQQQQPPVVTAKLRDPISDPSVHDHEFPVPGVDERMIASDAIQKHIQDLQRLRLEEQQGIYRRKSDDNLSGGFPVSAGGGEYYVHKVPEKVPQVPVQGTVGVPTTGYWPEKQVAGGVFPTSSLGSDQQVYMIPAPGGGYHAPMVRPMTGPTTQGYYAVQRMAPEVYREQQMYNVVQNAPSAVPSVGAAPPSLPPQQGQQHKVAAYSDGYGMVRSATTGIVENPSYAPMAYDNGVGRQVYYAAQGGVMAAPPHQQPQQGQPQFQGMAGVGSDVKVTLNQEPVKLVPKATTQASV